MTEKRRVGTNARCPSYRGVCFIEVSVIRELTVSAISANFLSVQLGNLHLFV